MRLPRTHTPLSHHSDEGLMELVGRGNHAALDELYGRYAARLLAYFDRMLDRNECISQDFLHDLFVKIIERPAMFDTARTFRTWVFSVAHNMCKNEYRLRRVRRFEELDVDHIASESVDVGLLVDGMQFAKALDAELRSLGVELRTTFLLRYQEELSIREIAAIVDVPEGTVKSRLFNTARRLARRLACYRPGPGMYPTFDLNSDLELKNERYG